MVKTLLQVRGAHCLRTRQRLQFAGFGVGGSLVLSLAVLTAWMPVADSRPVRVQGNFNAAPVQSVNLYPVLPFTNSLYGPVQTNIQPDSGFGLSVQIGTPTYSYSTYSTGYGYGQPGFSRRGSVNNSVLINPTVINSPIRNSTLVNPTIVNSPYTSVPYYPAPYYPAPYYDIQTVTTVTRPEPEVVIDPQYGVRYKSPPVGSQREVVVDPQYGVRYQTVPSGY